MNTFGKDAWASIMAQPSIEQQIAELNAAGWVRAPMAHVWKSPEGKLFLGPHGAWKAMRGLGGCEVTIQKVSERP